MEKLAQDFDSTEYAKKERVKPLYIMAFKGTSYICDF